jgi:hypothetical protein
VNSAYIHNQPSYGHSTKLCTPGCKSSQWLYSSSHPLDPASLSAHLNDTLSQLLSPRDQAALSLKLQEYFELWIEGEMEDREVVVVRRGRVGVGVLQAVQGRGLHRVRQFTVSREVAAGCRLRLEEATGF